MDSTRTIYELKSTFIRSQIRILSESLELPDDWQQYAVEIEEGPLSAKAIEDVLHKVNTAAKQHHRFVYASQAIHHVASQIASLYWSAISQEAQTQAAFVKGVGQLTDLSKQWNIAKLPFELETPGVTEEQNTRYQELRKRLASLDEKRQKRQRRRDQLQHLRRLLEPFEEPPRDIQPNLVSRDGELVQELEKMRMLMARVGGRIAQQKNRGHILENEEGEYFFPGSDQRLEALLNTNE
ncbi:unnamed protein product [Penicillium manginii]